MARKITHSNTSAKGTGLTTHNSAKKGEVLTNKNTRPFVVCFEDRLHKNYNFAKLTKSNLKKFQAFLDKVSTMMFSDVDKQYWRKPDKEDVYKDMQVVHYAVSDSFRIHGVVKNERFCVIRLDPNHKVHN